MKFNQYEILGSIGKGGMGEVFLAHDPFCGRDVALKQMMEKWSDNETMKNRFLREARIAAQLAHPSIIPIYSIEKSFYTMPYIEGESLKEIISKAKAQTLRGEPLHPIGHSISALVRIFLSVCGAVGYAHSQGVLHRDLKPDNIMVGKFGEVIILDWGLADFIDHPENLGLDFATDHPPHLTQPGKIAGTLLYMAPERAFGKKSTVQSDIYSLGVLLYQLLTLHLPFKRRTIKEYRKVHEHEQILNPEEIAPEREISPHLSSIAMRCMAKKSEKRFQSMPELIRELENYIEGVPEWQDTDILRIDKKRHWQFQENVALARHMALTRGIDTTEWFNLMVSKSQFPGNIKIEADIILQDGSHGIGILFCIPETNLSRGLEQSYCLWISEKGVFLYRSNVEVMHFTETQILHNHPYRLKITLVDNHVRFFLDNELQFSFVSNIPLAGTRVGLLTRDGNFYLSGLEVSVGSQNIMVNCLAVPDAFLAHKEYDQAFQEYRKISHSFPGRAEGREATFRAGLTLLKKAEKARKKTERENFYQGAFEEFEKLHYTPGAPLEYLGKSLVYKSQEDFEEEAKCLELALRKFPKHPLKPIIEEHLLSRLQESSQTNRAVGTLFALIVLRHLPLREDAKIIAELVENSLEPLPFFIPSENREMHLILQLAFWLNKPLALYELLGKGLKEADAQNAKIGLILLGNEELSDLSVLENVPQAQFEYALKNKLKLPDAPFPLWKALHEKDWKQAKTIVNRLDKALLLDETDPHFFLYGCYLAREEGEAAALAHLTNISDKKSPPTTTLLSHYLMGRIDLKKGWIDRAFSWEKLKLFEQLDLFNSCLEKN